MTRTGSFGRQPRAVASLTATLLNIAREQQNRQDQNIMDAWQKGGLFEGKKVTDKMILAYWKARAGGVSKDDPLYDTYHNSVLQLDYSIHESKMTADYALLRKPGAGDDQKMANFYLNWAKKVPKDSEFYRVLQRDAGQFLRAASAKRDAGTKATAEQKYRVQMGAIEKKWELPGQLALNVVTMLAQRGSKGQNAILGEQPLGNPSDIADRTNISELQLPSIDEMVALLGTVNVQGPRRGERSKPGSTGQGTPSVLYYNESGAPVTGRDITAMLSAADPNFNGSFDIDSIRQLMATQKQGLQRRVDLAKKTGHTSEMMTLQGQMARVNEYGNEIAAWPVVQSYSDLKTELDGVMKDDTLLPAAKVAAIDRIRKDIGKLADDPRIAADGHMQSQLRGEANGQAGVMTLGEDMEGLRNGFTTEQSAQNSEVMNITSIHDQLSEAIDLTNDPESGYVMTQGNYGHDGVFTPATGGKAVGAALMTDVANLPGAGPAIVVMVPNGDGGGATPMTVVPAPVFATAQKADGTNMDMANKNPVCSFVRYNVNGVETTLYGITDSTSKQVRWTNDPPWDQSKFKTDDTSGTIRLSFKPDAVPSADNTGVTGGAVPGFTGFTIEGKHPANRGSKGSAGKLVFDPAAAVLGTSPERQAAGPDPNTDSFSPTLIALKSTPDGQALLKQYASDPTFAKIVQNDAYRAAGMTFDVTLGTWNGTPEQQQAYSGFLAKGQVELDKARNGIDPASPQSYETPDAWERNSTQTQTLGASVAPVSVALPTEALRSSADERFQHMYRAFKPGTNMVAPARPDEPGGGILIQQPKSLTVPSFKLPVVTGPTVAPVTPTVQPVQPTATPPPPPPPSSGYQNTHGQQEY